MTSVEQRGVRIGWMLLFFLAAALLVWVRLPDFINPPTGGDGGFRLLNGERLFLGLGGRRWLPFLQAHIYTLFALRAPLAAFVLIPFVYALLFLYLLTKICRASLSNDMLSLAFALVLLYSSVNGFLGEFTSSLYQEFLVLGLFYLCLYCWFFTKQRMLFLLCLAVGLTIREVFWIYYFVFLLMYLLNNRKPDRFFFQLLLLGIIPLVWLIATKQSLILGISELPAEFIGDRSFGERLANLRNVLFAANLVPLILSLVSSYLLLSLIAIRRGETGKLKQQSSYHIFSLLCLGLSYAYILFADPWNTYPENPRIAAAFFLPLPFWCVLCLKSAQSFSKILGSIVAIALSAGLILTVQNYPAFAIPNERPLRVELRKLTKQLAAKKQSSEQLQVEFLGMPYFSFINKFGSSFLYHRIAEAKDNKPSGKADILIAPRANSFSGFQRYKAYGSQQVWVSRQLQQEKQTAAAKIASPLLAARPPMGWNSFDAYDSRITEAQFKANVDFIAKHLKQFGWQYAVIDFIWFNPKPGAWNNPKKRPGHADLRLDNEGRPIDLLAMDEYGRLLPAVERFPSAAEGRGFAPLADYLHAKGLKFGIHVMRGIPRQAYFANSAILGSKYRAKDIADPNSTCRWNNNMFGVDPDKPGAQQYYDSVFKQYAEWGVDFIKLDDASSPIFHEREIELIRKAIEASGRPMLLSLSPGPAPLDKAAVLQKQAQMWRISKDFWDDWSQLKAMFPLLAAWANHSGPDNWPDADMLPIGRLSLGGRPRGAERDSKFSETELRTMLTLWAVARSPLMIGGDLPQTKPEVIALLKNKYLIAVNQLTKFSRQVSANDNTVCWFAQDETINQNYLALFNLSDNETEVSCDFSAASLQGEYQVRDIWNGEPLKNSSDALVQTLPAHGAGLYRLIPQDN